MKAQVTIATIGLCILLFVPTMEAQDYRARVQGVVTDSSQAVIVGASVTLTNTNTGVQTDKVTNEIGQYIFDYVEPGSYTLVVELPGFSRFVQENMPVQSRGDITVNAVLKLGSVQETVTVTESPVAVQFNSTSMTLTVDTKLANELPRFDRNPFKLALLDPAAVNTRGEMNPYHSWAANSIELGGGTNLKNDLQIDGSPIGTGHKAGYTPSPDAVQEVIIMQNSVDAESGHSAGGVISITMKSGTNEVHGNAFYLGRNPALNAVTDRTTGSKSAARNNMWGGSVGHPIIKDKLFNFFTYEQWNPRDPLSIIRTLPTTLERAGDFSQSRNIDGGIRAIFDPWSTVFDPATGAVTRAQFPGNRIPASRIDSLSTRLLQSLWEPNNPGDNITGINNYKTSALRLTNYKNFSNRTDWNVNDRWKVHGRYSRIHTIVNTLNPTPNQSEAFGPKDLSLRHALSISGDAVWTLTPTTVLNFHGDYHSLVDDYGAPGADLGKDGWSKFWPDNPWYKPFETELPVYHPRFHVGGSHFGGHTVFWYQHPNGESFSAKISQQRGAHYLKAGVETRRSGGASLVTGTTGFMFGPELTANTFISPNTRVMGHEYASFLLGALSPSSVAVSKPVKQPRTEYYAGYFQDDLKLSRRITLNLGLRYEFETPWHDPELKMSRFLDLTQPIPDIQANPPQMPAAVTAIAAIPYKYNGSWVFTDSKHPGIWEAQKGVFMPRAGLALRIDDRSSLRFGYARYVIPTEYNFSPSPFAGFEAINFLEPAYLGFDATQNITPVLEGIPQAIFSNPFPAASNPLLPPRGKDFGRYLGLGGQNLVWFYQDFKRGVNDRVNLSFQRELPNQIVVDVTYFTNFGRNVPFTHNLNQADPRLAYQHKSAIDANVANPFYQYLTEDKFPGPLRNQRTVSVRSLLRPYPQYAGLFEAYTPDRRERYNALQIRVQRAFRDGYNFLFGYTYHREKTSEFFDEVAAYLKEFTFQESANPRHRISAAGIYEFPFGKERAHLANLHPVLDGILGGWQLNGVFYFNTGDFLRPGVVLVDGDPTLSNPTPDRWFDTSRFRQQPAYTARTNPWQYSGLKGPLFWDLDGTVSKQFRTGERLRTEFKVAAYNLTNRLNRNNPDLGVTSSTFGRALRQRTTTGRQIEFGLKILF